MIADHQVTARVLLRGVVPAELRLSYSMDDPAAIRIQVGCWPRPWYVARDRLARDLAREPAETVDDDTEWASRVHCSRLPRRGQTFLLLRSPTHRVPLSVDTDELVKFLDITYRLCPASRERQLVADGLDAHLALFTATQEGN